MQKQCHNNPRDHFLLLRSELDEARKAYLKAITDFTLFTQAYEHIPNPERVEIFITKGENCVYQMAEYVYTAHLTESEIS